MSLLLVLRSSLFCRNSLLDCILTLSFPTATESRTLRLSIDSDDEFFEGATSSIEVSYYLLFCWETNLGDAKELLLRVSSILFSSLWITLSGFLLSSNVNSVSVSSS